MAATATILTAVTVATSLAGAAVGVMQARNAAGAAAIERQQAEQSRRLERLRGQQEENERLRALRAVVGEQINLQGSRGVQLGSGTARRIEDETEDTARRDIENIRLNSRIRQQEASFAGFRAALRQRGARLQGLGSIIGGVSSAASKAAPLFKESA